MAANTIRTGSNGFPIHRGENLLTPGYLTELELRIPPTTEGPKRTDIAHGRIWLTDERVGIEWRAALGASWERSELGAESWELGARQAERCGDAEPGNFARWIAERCRWDIADGGGRNPVTPVQARRSGTSAWSRR